MSDFIVSNAGPLMVFSKLNLLHIFKELYGRLFFPTAVYRETVIHGIQHGFEDAYSLRIFLNQNGWQAIEVHEISNSLLSANLDQGEREAIALSVSKKATLLIDEELGRRIAREHGLKVKGSLGVLIEAYRKKIITYDQLQFYFSQISERRDIWISPLLCRQLLENLGRY